MIASHRACRRHDQRVASCRTVRSSEVTSASPERGAVLVEFSLASIVVVVLIIGLFDLMRIGYTTFAVQHSAQQAAHWGAVGTVIGTMTREQSIKEKFRELSARFGVDVDVSRVRVCPILDADCTVDDAGDAGQLFLVRYDHPSFLFVLPMNLALKTTAAARNEPYVAS